MTNFVRTHLPSGRTLPPAEWERRHRGIVVVLWALALCLPLYGLLVGHASLHGVVGGAALAATAWLARVARPRRTISSATTSLGLCMASALAVHLASGAIEAHFMFFVVIIVVSQYEDWRPFLVALGFVVVHHGVMGMIDRASVYDHGGNPWVLAAIHGGFVVAASIAAVVGWRLNEDVRAETIGANRKARASDARFRSAFEYGPVGMALIGAAGPSRGTLVRVNRTLSERLGYDVADLVGRGLEVLLDPAGEARVLVAIDDLASGRTKIYHDELAFGERTGGAFDGRISMSLVSGSEGVRDVIVQIEDVTERNRLQRELHDLADLDPLTGLFNRRRFERELSGELDCAHAGGRGGAAILIDLDGFKGINDTLGHQAGDQMLVAASQAVADSVRGSDAVGRLGGDEFAVLLRAVTAEEAAAIGSAIVERVAAWAVIGEGVEARRVTASLGVVVFAQGADLTAGELLNDADLAMYEAKGDGGNRCVLYAPDPAATPAGAPPVSWLDRIRRAFDEDCLLLYAQPILDIERGEVSRYELLLRMRGPGGEIIPPAAFLPVAERRGMIRTIDRWVVREAITLLEQCRGEIRLQVNISGRSLSDPDFLDYTRSELAASSAAASDLVFEVTETTAIANLEVARSFLADLAKMGCGISLDDFGSGFASFQYLKSLPFDELKIDGQFIQNVTTNPDDLLLVETLVGLARGLGKRTVAEYVEDASTLRLIRDLGVDYAQGFFVGKPAPATTLVERLAASGRATRSRP